MTRASFRLFRTGLIVSIIVELEASKKLTKEKRLPEQAIMTTL